MGVVRYAKYYELVPDRGSILYPADSENPAWRTLAAKYVARVDATMTNTAFESAKFVAFLSRRRESYLLNYRASKTGFRPPETLRSDQLPLDEHENARVMPSLMVKLEDIKVRITRSVRHQLNWLGVSLADERRPTASAVTGCRAR